MSLVVEASSVTPPLSVVSHKSQQIVLYTVVTIKEVTIGLLSDGLCELSYCYDNEQIGRVQGGRVKCRTICSVCNLFAVNSIIQS